VPISIDTLRSASFRSGVAKSASTLTEAHSLGVRTAFLCHSHDDENMVRGLLNLFQEDGWRVYVDWQDPAMGEKPTRETAEKIKLTIRVMDYFLFLATPNSVASRWCPWEIGYADSEKAVDRILIIPTTDRSGTWYGNEYLQLYRKIDEAEGGKLGVWNPGESKGVWLATL
jgi:hypothetical protein